MPMMVLKAGGLAMSVGRWVILGALVLSGCEKNDAGSDCAQRFGGLIAHRARLYATYTLSPVEYSRHTRFDDRRPITDRPGWTDWLASTLVEKDTVVLVRKDGMPNRIFRMKAALPDPVETGCRLETSGWRLTRIISDNPAIGVRQDVSVESRTA
jgi:hypothetical protein